MAGDPRSLPLTGASRLSSGVARRPLALVLALGLLAVGCGGGIRETAGVLTSPPVPTPTPSASTMPSPTPTGEPPIEVRIPAAGGEIRSPVTVAGSADVFEATVSIRILDETGLELAAGFATATCGSGCRGRYSTELYFFVDRAQPGTVEVFESSAEDGSQLFLVSIPVTLLPGA